MQIEIKSILYDLLRGFAYLRIKHKCMPIYRFYVPAVLTFFIVVIYFLLPIKPSLIGSKSISEAMLSFISLLPGFYFVGLTAVATFGRTTMDQRMPEPAPLIQLLVNGEKEFFPLTRRLFLSYMFSYLVVLSFILYTLLTAFNILQPSIYVLRDALTHTSLGNWSWISLEFLTGVFVTFLFSSMLIITLHGIFFLTEKIHQPS